MQGRLPLLVSLDARRPASWLALAAAALVALLLADAASTGCPAPMVMAVMAGALLAVMAIGDAAPTPHGSDIDLAWLVERAAWPLVGWLVSAGVRGDVALLAGGGVGIALGATLVATLRRRGALAADAASVALVAAGCAGAAGWWADAAWPGQATGGRAAVGVSIGLTIAAAAVFRRRHARTAIDVRYTARHLLTAAAMMGAMAGMVGWLFLAADLAAFDLVASLAWFVALAVPAATLGDGVSHAAVWRRLERITPQPAGARLRLAPGRTRDGIQATLTTAALLGWPPLVAATLAGADEVRSGMSLLVVAAVAAAATLLLVIVGLGQAARATPDTQLAVAVAGVCLCMTAASVLWSGQAPEFLVRPFVGW